MIGRKGGQIRKEDETKEAKWWQLHHQFRGEDDQVGFFWSSWGSSEDRLYSCESTQRSSNRQSQPCWKGITNIYIYICINIVNIFVLMLLQEKWFHFETWFSRQEERRSERDFSFCSLLFLVVTRWKNRKFHELWLLDSIILFVIYTIYLWSLHVDNRQGSGTRWDN